MLMKTPLAFTLAWLFVSASVQAGILAGPIVNPTNGHSYYLLTTNTWTASEAEALWLGGHLATINDLEENQWILNTFTQITGDPKASFWIGLNDVAVEGQFVWASGDPVVFTYWYPGEPNDAGGVEDYVTIRPASAVVPGSWNDQPDRTNAGTPDYPIFGVVEVEAPRVTIQVATVAVRWPSTTGTVYQLQYRSSLTGDIWTNLGAPIDGTGSNIVVLDSVLDQPRRFYRVQLAP